MFINYIIKNIVMKKLTTVLIIFCSIIFAIRSQTVTNSSCVLDNGITLKTEHGWGHVWVTQSYESIKDGTQVNPLALNIRTLGDLISSSTYKLLSNGKEVKQQGLGPGTYDLKLTFKLSGKPGTLSLVIGNVVIKPKTKTSVAITLYDYQVAIAETQGSLKGLSGYESTVSSFKGSADQNPYHGVFTFYAKGKHDVKINPDEATTDIKGKIKPGTYDVLITIGISNQKHEVWLENFAMKPDISYKIATNLNAGVIVYTGSNKEVRSMHLYPAGTAQQMPKPLPDKVREIIAYETSMSGSACSPGQFDVMLEYGKGAKYEWKPGIVVQSGARKEVR
jgi:hypothetical protein